MSTQVGPSRSPNTEPECPVYVERDVDAELQKTIARGELVIVLGPLHVGKTSLMYRAAGKLREKGHSAVTLDLEQIQSAATSVNWSSVFAERICRDLGIEPNYIKDWLSSHKDFGAEYFTSLFRDLVLNNSLTKRRDRIVIFIDRLESALEPAYRENFISGLQYLLETRKQNANLQKLSLVLLGNALEHQIAAITSIDIWQVLHLGDFCDLTRTPFERCFSGKPGVLDRIMHWTEGQPYLVQALSQELLTHNENISEKNVDNKVRELFLRSKIEQEKHLSAIQQAFSRAPQDIRDASLSTYDSVLENGQAILQSESPVRDHLLQCGLARATALGLVPRNPIYKSVFNHSWIKSQLQPEKKLLALNKLLLFGLATAAVLIAFLLWKGLPPTDTTDEVIETMLSSPDAQDRRQALDKLKKSLANIKKDYSKIINAFQTLIKKEAGCSGEGIGLSNQDSEIPCELDVGVLEERKGLIEGALQALGSRHKNPGASAEEYLDLARTDLRAVYLPSINVPDPLRFSKIDFSYVNLRNANFSGAVLDGAIFEHANLDLCTMAKAVLRNAKLNFAIMLDAKLPDAILNGAELRDAVLKRASFLRAYLIEAKLDRADLSGADFRGAYMSKAVFRDAIMPEAELNEAKLMNVNLAGAYLAGANLSGADLSGGDLSGVDLSGADLSGVDMSDVTMDDANLDKADVTGIRWQEIKSMKNTKMVDVVNPPDGFMEFAKRLGAKVISRR